MSLGTPCGATPRVAIDVSALPTYSFAHRSLMWWGTLGFVGIETAGFGLAIATYLLLRAEKPNLAAGLSSAGPTPGYRADGIAAAKPHSQSVDQGVGARRGRDQDADGARYHVYCRDPAADRQSLRIHSA